EINTDVIDSEVVVTEEVQSDNSGSRSGKSSFLGFLNFLIAISALAGCAFLYLKTQQPVHSEQTDKWQEPLTQLQQKTEQKFSSLSLQIEKITQTNSDLHKQLEKIENIALAMQASKENQTQNAELMQYDDTLIIQQLDEIKREIVSQKGVLSKTQQQLELQKNNFQKALNELKSTGGVAGSENQNNQKQQTANYVESLLNAAQMQLEIYQNPDKSRRFLESIRKKIENTADFSGFANEVDNAINAIQQVEIPDYPRLKTQVDYLSQSASQLFSSHIENNQTDDSKENSSWFDNLIVIRKIEPEAENNPKKEELSIAQAQLQNYFESLQTAIRLKNDENWQNNLAAIISLLKQNSSTESSDILQQLEDLKAVNLNPQYPDLSKYLQKFRSFNSSNFLEENNSQPQDKSAGL
ncbi:MAG TPA: hypothetical protein PK055_12480, partial [Gammaproteobacteria bacterium]|nr:hypothetical protein [Gammaproteobacteria bacterium]HPQ88462.1 hypothetical protein [Gammaproteobacteria bacterium]